MGKTTFAFQLVHLGQKCIQFWVRHWLWWQKQDWTCQPGKLHQGFTCRCQGLELGCTTALLQKKRLLLHWPMELGALTQPKLTATKMVLVQQFRNRGCPGKRYF